MSLHRIFLGSLARRRVATLFSFIAIVLGVALGMAVQVVHEAALREFGHGLRSMAGNADLQVVGPRGGFDEDIYARLVARPEIAAASPIVEVEVQLSGRPTTLHVLGVDIFSLAAVTPTLLPRPADEDRYAALRDDALFLSRTAQDTLGVAPGNRLSLQAGGHNLEVRVAGDLPAADDDKRLAVMDIATVQKHYAYLGRLSRIDLRLATDVTPQTARSTLQTLLPAGVLVQAPAAAEQQAENLSRAYRVNLTMLAAMALLTGGFLVFSAQALSVVRRRSEFAFLRAIGLARRQLFVWLLVEGAVIGLAGGLVGTAFGYLLAWVLLSLLGGDLGAGYFAGLRPTIDYQPGVTACYVLLGTLAGIVGAWLPAREAASVAPAQALKAGDEAALLRGRGRPVLGLGILALSLAACRLPPLDGLPVGGYLAIACLLTGGVLCLPLIAAAVGALLPQSGPLPGRLAAARLAAAPGHTVIAAAGVLTSVALAAAMAIMVASFRESVDQWLNQVLAADLYLRAGPLSAGHLDPEMQAKIKAVPGIRQVNFTRHDTLRLSDEKAPLVLLARPISANQHELPLTERHVYAADQSPALWISEAARDEYAWHPGQHVTIPLGGSLISARIAGVWRDYARQSGAAVMALTDYRRLTGDLVVNDAAILLDTNAVPGVVARRLLAIGEPGALQVTYPGEIRKISLNLFDRTFAVTYVLEAAAIAIGLAGVAASFAALSAARRREFGMLRHLGLTRRQIAWMLTQEGALAAAIGVCTGLITGAAIGLVLIEVVNRQSFHWSMDLHVPWTSLAIFAVTLIILAALAAVLAGRQAMRDDAVLAVRDDW